MSTRRSELLGGAGDDGLGQRQALLRGALHVDEEVELLLRLHRDLGGRGALQQLELWKTYYDYWCDGNPSQTIYYTDENFFDVQAWVYKNFDSIGGLSFFPFDDFIYDETTQPYLPITKERYDEEVAKFPKDIDWCMDGYESDDNTTSSQELSCAGGACEL